VPILAGLAFAGLAVIAGGVAAITGFGIGSLLTPAVAVAVGTKSAVAIVSIPHLIATSARLWGLRHSVDRSVLLRFGLPSAAGGLAGALLHAVFANPILTIVLGLLLVLSGLSELTGWASRLRLTGAWAVLAGVVSGVFGGLVGNQGGIRSAALLRFDLTREAIVATATASAILVDVARVPVYLATSGAEVAAAIPLVVVLAGGGLVGTFLGAPVLRSLPDPAFRRVLAVLLIALGLALIGGEVVGSLVDRPATAAVAFPSSR
jgi:uncharacterized membrane protein YfcA